tara:strand:+ start:3401 stop:3892 length:492 start_codon:yes stop_codon:yes gene_type:complete
MGALSGFMPNVEGAFESALFHAVEEKPSGTSGDTTVSGSYTVRTLNTVKANNIPGVSLSANRITLPAGSYYIAASAPGCFINAHRVAVFRPASASYISFGTSEFANQNDGASRSFLFVKYSPSVTVEIEFRHYAQTANSSGLGRASSSGDPEIYTEVKIWKVA